MLALFPLLTVTIEPEPSVRATIDAVSQGLLGGATGRDPRSGRRAPWYSAAGANVERVVCPRIGIEATVANGWLTLKDEVKHQSQSDAVLDGVVPAPEDWRNHEQEIVVIAAGIDGWSTEQSPEVVDAAMSGLCGTVVRRSAVEAESGR